MAAQADYQRYQFEGARLAPLPIRYHATTGADCRADGNNLHSGRRRKQFEITRQRFKLGAVPRNDEFALVTQVEQTRQHSVVAHQS